MSSTTPDLLGGLQAELTAIEMMPMDDIGSCSSTVLQRLVKYRAASDAMPIYNPPNARV